MSFWTNICNVFWSPYFWLPEGETWHTFDSKQTGLHGNYTGIYFATAMAICLLRLQPAMKRLFITPIGRYLGLGSKRRTRHPHNKTLENLFKMYGPEVPEDIKEELEKSINLSAAQIQFWMKNRKYAEKLEQKLIKFVECGWKFVYYAFSASYGLSALWNKTWFWNMEECWKGAPYHTLEVDVWFYCWICAGFYLASMFSVFIETRRGDFKMMVAHHFITLFLMSLTWFSNLTRIGSVFLLLHDISDAFLEIAKMCKYVGYIALGTFFFVIFALLWHLTRVLYYPYVLYSIMFQAQYLMKTTLAFQCFRIMAVALFVLHIKWTFCIWNIIRNALKQGRALEDERSSDEDSD
ncbi:unnamed protein product [Orchesella dallaii]|uniref:Ceramide synthase 6 n=1 Tax=Orchesella dallaii TaxID=48710 RepID=A0ABP1RP07_9HEXA